MDPAMPSKTATTNARQQLVSPLSSPAIPREEDAGPPQITERPAPKFFPRPDNEWQGMLVDMSNRQLCERAADCGLALSCRADRMCGPCEADSDCLAGEICVLDHCVVAKLAACRSQKDCASEGVGALCVLTGPTGNDTRGNSKTRAYCSVPGEPVPGHEEQNEEQARAVVDGARRGRYERQPVTEGDLLSVLRKANAERR